LTFPFDGEKLGQFMLQMLKLVGLFEAAGALLKAQLKQRFFDFQHPAGDLLIAQGTGISRFGHCH
jgi:hypothetical protein